MYLHYLEYVNLQLHIIMFILLIVPSKQVAETMDMMMTTTKGTEGMVEVVSKKSKGMVSGPTPTIGAVIFTCVFLQVC